MIGGVVTSFALLGTLFGVLRWKTDEFDRTAFIALACGIAAMWFTPFGILVLGPLALIISVISPAGREEWLHFRQRRILTSIALVIILVVGAYTPVSTPKGAPAWGEPIATENPHAPAWPASEQYTWFHDGAVIGVLVTRTPHTFAYYGQSASTLEIGIMLGMHEDRLRQSIEVIDDKVPVISIDANAFSLSEVETEPTHNYNGEEYSVIRFEVIRDDGFTTTIANVIVVCFPSTGGELTLLTITRPLISPRNDVFEEMLVLQYIEANE